MAEQKSLEAEIGEDGAVRLVTRSVPERPIAEVDARLRLGTLIRRARVRAEKGLDEVAEILGISNVSLGQVERGMAPLATEKLQQIASLTGCDYDSLVEAARDFNTAIWAASPDAGYRMVESDGEAKMLFPVDKDLVLQMPPEQRFVEYREGWFAGASGRDDPGDMSDEWSRGHEDGRVAMESALHAKRVALDIHYGEGKAGSPE